MNKYTNQLRSAINSDKLSDNILDVFDQMELLKNKLIRVSSHLEVIRRIDIKAPVDITSISFKFQGIFIEFDNLPQQLRYNPAFADSIQILAYQCLKLLDILCETEINGIVEEINLLIPNKNVESKEHA